MAGKLKSVKLQTETDVNRYLAKVINSLHRDEIDPTKAAKLGYLCNLLIGGLRNSNLEARVAKIERNLESEGMDKAAPATDSSPETIFVNTLADISEHVSKLESKGIDIEKKH